ncbi:MAG: class II fructose-bisphosphate aldolase [Candidatus Gribaldobacteria bacterium]|nr:class II fructose-bisphosphate aldolase [Candidatus Gribaldobacteria bacterium]
MSNFKLESTQKLYAWMAEEGRDARFSVPAFNIRMLTQETAKAIFRAARKEKCGTFIIEIARSEMGYTTQTPQSFASDIKMAAEQEKWDGPIFLQGDHYSLKNNTPAENQTLEQLVIDSIQAGFYNIDIDCSKLVDLSQPSIAKQQAGNTEKTIQLIKLIRQHQPDGIKIAVGGEVDKIGGQDTTTEELETFLTVLNQEILAVEGLSGIAKVACQMGTTHGGIVLANGDMAPVQIDFAQLAKLSQVAQKYGLAGVVQHGASTLPNEYFTQFPNSGVCEVHLSTEFQNIVFDHPAFPAKLKEKMYQWIDDNCLKEKNQYENKEQFYYRARKKTIGIFKDELNNLSKKNLSQISKDLEKKFRFFMQQLKVSNTQGIIRGIYN